MSGDVESVLRAHVREIPDYPEPGVRFKDITPLLADPVALRTAVDALAAPWAATPGSIDVVAGIEARGFILAAPVALALGAGFAPVRKAGRLPHTTYAESYALEYGEATVEVHTDAFRPGARVLVVDDVLATGGTACATLELVRRTGASAVGAAFLIELSFLAGRRRVQEDAGARAGLDVHAVLRD